MRWSEGNDFRFGEFLKRADHGGRGRFKLCIQAPVWPPVSSFSTLSPAHFIPLHSNIPSQAHQALSQDFWTSSPLASGTFSILMMWMIPFHSSSRKLYGLLSPAPEPSYIVSYPSQHSEQLWAPWRGGCVSSLSQDSDWPRGAAIHVWRMNEQILCPEWGLYRINHDHAWVWTTCSLQVCLEVRLVTGFSLLPLPLLCLFPFKTQEK